MVKIEFLDALERELRRKHVADAAEILGEYEAHFAFKLADGYTEEEIAARLGEPSALAMQFEPAVRQTFMGRKVLTITGLCFADLFVVSFFALLFAWALTMAVSALSFALLTICLFLGPGKYVLIPPMPYWCGAVFGLASAALAVLVAVGCVCFFALMRQLLRSYGRFHRNAVASAWGGVVLPPLAVYPQFSAKVKRRLRTVALASLILFAVCFVLGMLASMLSAGTLEFWHAWGWFGY